MSYPVQGTEYLSTTNTPVNATAFLVEQIVRKTVNTADVVSVKSATQSGTEGAAGYAAATPLVCPITSRDQALPSARIAKMPFYRPQAGKAAIVMDPQPGDKAVAVFMKRDSSIVRTGTKDPVQPGSFRCFDQADGYLFNGFLGEAPEIWLHLNPVSGDISLSTKAANIDISCRESGDIDIKTGSGNVTITATEAVNITAGESITLNAPEIALNGNLTATSGNGGTFISSSGAVSVISGNGGTSLASSGGTSVTSGGELSLNGSPINVNEGRK